MTPIEKERKKKRRKERKQESLGQTFVCVCLLKRTVLFFVAPRKLFHFEIGAVKKRATIAGPAKLTHFVAVCKNAHFLLARRCKLFSNIRDFLFAFI